MALDNGRGSCGRKKSSSCCGLPRNMSQADEEQKTRWTILKVGTIPFSERPLESVHFPLKSIPLLAPKHPYLPSLNIRLLGARVLLQALFSN